MSSPKFKRSSKLKFIKNIKPETFKRPSSTFANEQAVTGSVAGMHDPNQCQLVGYRKRDSNTFAPIMELGTLSPSVTRTSSVRESSGITVSAAAADRGGALQSAASLPSLAGRGGLALVSSGSMPELTRTNSLLSQQGERSRAATQPHIAIEQLAVDKAANEEGDKGGGQEEEEEVETKVEVGSTAGDDSSSLSPDGVEIAINGIELDPDVSNSEILMNLAEHAEATNSDLTNGASSGATVSETNTKQTMPLSAADKPDFREVSVDMDDGKLSEKCTILEMFKDEYDSTQENKAGKLGMARLNTAVTSSSTSAVTSQPTRNEFGLVPSSGSSPDRTHLLVSPVPDATIR